MRFNALSHIWPNKIPKNPDFNFHPFTMGIQEIAFWANRVNVLNIAGTVVAHELTGTHSFTIDQNAQMINPITTHPCEREVDAYLVGGYDLTYNAPNPPPGLHPLTMEFTGFEDFAVRDGEFSPFISFLMFGSGGSISSYNPAAAAGVSLTMIGIDLLFGERYERSIALFGSGYTGSLLITPHLWWPYADDSDPANTALYDSMTGDRLPMSG